MLVNGAECEPLLRTDQQLAAVEAELLVEGLAYEMEAVGAREGIIAFKAKYRAAIEAVKPLLRSNMRIEILRDIYPAGDEAITIWLVTGRRVPPGNTVGHRGSSKQRTDRNQHSESDERGAGNGEDINRHRVRKGAGDSNSSDRDDIKASIGAMWGVSM